jgi:hypothetical protein
MAIPGDQLRQSENIAGCCKRDTSYDRRAGCGHDHFVVRAITEGPRARPCRQKRQRSDTNQVGARAALQERRSPELAKSNHLAFEKAPLAWIATSGLCFVLPFISINEHFLDKIRRFRYAFVAVSDIHSTLAR